MPATAAIDNETLDHLLSVVDDSRSVRSIRRLSKRALEPRWNLRAISVGAAAARSWRECGISELTPAQPAVMLDGVCRLRPGDAGHAAQGCFSGRFSGLRRSACCTVTLQAASRSASESDSLWALSKACGLCRHSPT